MKNHEFPITISNNILEKSIENFNDITELKIFLRILYLIHQKQNINIISFDEISKDDVISKLLEDSNSLIKEQKPKILKQVCDGLVMNELIHQKTYTNSITGEKKNVFFIDSFAKENIQTNQNGITDSNTKKPDNIFQLYEDNIGMLNPMIVDELIEAENKFPFNWIIDAVKESVTRNKRNWRYIHTILDTWDREGRTNERTLGNSEKTGYGEYFKR